jgi:hypothetical protein
LAQDADEAKFKVCYAQSWIPTLPQETFGIPAFADFEVTSFEKPIMLAGVDGVTLAKFMNDFVPFVVVLEYDATKYERRFSKEEVQKQVTIFEKSYNPQSVPRIMRKTNAKLPPAPPLVTILPRDPPKNPLSSSPIPSVGLPKILE